ncbi:MAG: BON domain-containing protein [Bryobacteraceae bacterium]
MKKYLCALVIAAAAAGLGQAASVAASGAAVSKSAAVKTPTAQRVLPDAQIERNIRAKLAKSKMSATEHFTVSVQNGVATLGGKTNVIQHKGVATRLAKSGGAIAVRNQIQVSEEAKAKAAAKLAKYRAGQAEPVRATVLQAQSK